MNLIFYQYLKCVLHTFSECDTYMLVAMYSISSKAVHVCANTKMNSADF